MNRWIGKLAVVTGASSGIGARIAIDLVNAGMIVVGLARRVERVEELKANISTTTTGELHALRCDVTKEEDVLAAFEWIETKFGGVDVLVNNAGVLRSTRLTTKDNTTAIRDVIDTNIFAVVMCTREAFQSMRRRNFDGHIFLMNSIGGHSVAFLDSFNIYQPSKYAVTAMTEVLRQEFQTEGTRIKVTVNKNEKILRVFWVIK